MFHSLSKDVVCLFSMDVFMERYVFVSKVIVQLLLVTLKN